MPRVDYDYDEKEEAEKDDVLKVTEQNSKDLFNSLKQMHKKK